jgi:hypothetical protein
MDDRTLQKALQLMRELRWAELCILLHRLKQKSYQQWDTAKEVLFRHASDYRQLSILATVFQCSIKSELSSCYPMIPGLMDLDRE